jgi:hypothetical protein
MNKSLKAPLIGVIICQIILLCLWTNLYPDADVQRSDAVTNLLNSTNNEVQAKTDVFLARVAIRGSSRDLEMMDVVVIASSLTVIFLSIVSLMRVRKKD